VFSWYLWESYSTNANLFQESNVHTIAKNGPVGALHSCFQNWWIAEEFFFEWLLHFKQFAKPSKDEAVLMIGTPMECNFKVLK
jgi:hypothetical protein